MDTASQSAVKRSNVTIFEVFIEFVKHFDNLVFLIPALGMCGWVATTDPEIQYLGWFVLGWLIFLPQEYLTHVYILHAKLTKSEPLYRIMYRLHYGHHDLPRRADLMYMPLWLTIPMAIGNMLIFALITQTPEQWMVTLSGLFSGYLLFEFTHLICHVPHRPKTKWGKLVRSHHLWHHYRNENHWFSVSLPALPIDILFGTAGEKEDVKLSGTAEYLGFDKDHQWVRNAREHFAKRSNGDMDSSRLWQLPQ